MTTANRYVRAAAFRSDSPADDRTRVTGRVLHLAVWAPVSRGSALLHGAGRYTPLCGSPIPRAVDAWVLTGPGIPGWDGHAHWPVCHHCVRAMDRLLSDLTAQDDRHDEHDGARTWRPGDDLTLPPLPDDAYPPGAVDLIAELRTPGAPAIPVHLTTERTDPA